VRGLPLPQEVLSQRSRNTPGPWARTVEDTCQRYKERGSDWASRPPFRACVRSHPPRGLEAPWGRSHPLRRVARQRGVVTDGHRAARVGVKRASALREGGGAVTPRTPPRRQAAALSCGCGLGRGPGGCVAQAHAGDGSPPFTPTGRRRASTPLASTATQSQSALVRLLAGSRVIRAIIILCTSSWGPGEHTGARCPLPTATPSPCLVSRCGAMTQSTGGRPGCALPSLQVRGSHCRKWCFRSAAGTPRAMGADCRRHVSSLQGTWKWLPPRPPFRGRVRSHPLRAWGDLGPLAPASPCCAPARRRRGWSPCCPCWRTARLRPARRRRGVTRRNPN
jgi:hypothetical protein